MLYKAFFALLTAGALGLAALLGQPAATPAGAIPRATNTNTPIPMPIPTTRPVTPAPYPPPDGGGAPPEQLGAAAPALSIDAFGDGGAPAGRWYLWIAASPGELTVRFSAAVRIDYRSGGVACASTDGATGLTCQIAADATPPSGVLVEAPHDVRAAAQLVAAGGVASATWPRPPLTTEPTPAPTAPPAPLPARVIAIPVFNGSR